MKNTLSQSEVINSPIKSKINRNYLPGHSELLNPGGIFQYRVIGRIILSPYSFITGIWQVHFA